MEKPIPGIGLNFRRGGAKLRALGKSHRPLHILLWQAHEVQSSLIATAAAQNTLFTDIANWASSENRALSDVCATTSELFSQYATAQIQLAVAFKSFRKDMALILEGERRCDASQKKLQVAESKRLKLRRQLLRIQNQNQLSGDNVRRSGDFTSLQTQLAESERSAERAHGEACDIAKEQEAVKLIVLRTALSKLSQSHLLIANQSKIIFDGGYQLAQEIPEPPPPGDQLSCVRYNGFNTTRAIVAHVKRLIQGTLYSSSPTGAANERTTASGVFIIDNQSLALTPSRGFTASTPVTSPDTVVGGHNGHLEPYHRQSTDPTVSSPSWALAGLEPSAPLDSGSFSSTTSPTTEPPPPYNSDFRSPSTNGRSFRNSSTSSSGSHSTTRRRYQNVSSVAPTTTTPNNPTTTPSRSSNSNSSRMSQSNIQYHSDANNIDQTEHNSLNYYYYNTNPHDDTHENEYSTSPPSSSLPRRRY